MIFLSIQSLGLEDQFGITNELAKAVLGRIISFRLDGRWAKVNQPLASRRVQSFNPAFDESFHARTSF